MSTADTVALDGIEYTITPVYDGFHVRPSNDVLVAGRVPYRAGAFFSPTGDGELTATDVRTRYEYGGDGTVPDDVQAHLLDLLTRALNVWLNSRTDEPSPVTDSADRLAAMEAELARYDRELEVLTAAAGRLHAGVTRAIARALEADQQVAELRAQRDRHRADLERLRSQAQAPVSA